MPKHTIEQITDIAVQHNVKFLDNHIPKNCKELSKWLCLKHNKEFLATVYDVQHNKSCQQCGDELRRINRRHTLEEYNNLAMEHNLTFISDLKDKEEVWKCNFCNKEFIAHFCHINYRKFRGCGDCTQKYIKHERRLQIKDYINNGIEHGYSYCDKTYRPNGKNEKVHWECINKHVFLASYSDIKNGKFCPECTRNNSEQECKEILEKLLNIQFIKCRPDFLRNNKTNCNLELDFYNEEHKLAFEYQGRQHYEFIKFFDKNYEEFLYRQNNDNLKLKLCEQANVKLIHIRYFNRNFTKEQKEIYIKNILLENNLIS